MRVPRSDGPFERLTRTSAPRGRLCAYSISTRRVPAWSGDGTELTRGVRAVAQPVLTSAAHSTNTIVFRIGLTMGSSKIESEPKSKQCLVDSAVESDPQVASEERPRCHVRLESCRDERPHGQRRPRAFDPFVLEEAARARHIVEVEDGTDLVGAAFPREIRARGNMGVKPGVVEELILEAQTNCASCESRLRRHV